MPAVGLFVCAACRPLANAGRRTAFRPGERRQKGRAAGKKVPFFSQYRSYNRIYAQIDSLLT